MQINEADIWEKWRREKELVEQCEAEADWEQANMHWAYMAALTWVLKMGED